MREEILEVAARRADALCAADVAALDELLADGFVYVNSLGRRLDRAAYLAFVRSGDLRWSAQEFADVEVVAFGDTAVMTCRVTDVGTWHGEPVRWDFMSTQVYVRRDGRWLYAAGHTATGG